MEWYKFPILIPLICCDSDLVTTFQVLSPFPHQSQVLLRQLKTGDGRDVREGDASEDDSDEDDSDEDDDDTKND